MLLSASQAARLCFDVNERIGDCELLMPAGRQLEKVSPKISQDAPDKTSDTWQLKGLQRLIFCQCLGDQLSSRIVQRTA